MKDTQEHTVELPGPPNSKALLGIISSPQNEATFNRQYARYSNVPYFAEARKAFTHKRLLSNSTTGVNTWHEQLLAGRVTPDDMKTLGYTNLAKWRSQTSMMVALIANGEMDARTLRAAFNAAKKSRVHYVNDMESVISASNIQFCIRVAEWFGAEGVIEFEHHMAVITTASDTINEMAETHPASAYSYAQYVEQHFRALRVMVAPPPQFGESPVGHNYRSYREAEFMLMMQAGLSPQQAAESALQNLSPERAIEASNLPRTMAQGVL